MNAILAVLVAFSVADWVGRRELLTREAERLQVAYSNCVAQASEPAEGVVIPIETHPDGAVKLSIAAKRAMIFLDKGLVWAEGVTIQKFDEKGVEDSRIEAESCVFDRDTKSGWVAGRMTMTKDKTVFTGRDVYFSSPEDYMISFGGSSISSEDMKFGGGL